MFAAGVSRLFHKRVRLLGWILGAFLLFSATLAMGQQPPSQLPRSPLPDENAPNTKTNNRQMSTKDVIENLRKGLDSKNAPYVGSNIKATVGDQSITLNGTVTSEGQLEMAMQLAQAYAGNRRIVNRLVIRP